MSLSENLISSESTDTLVDKLTIRSPKIKHEFSPFVFTTENTEPQVKLSVLRLLSQQGLLIFTLIPQRRFKDHSVNLAVKALCDILYKEYNETLATRIRRGIKDLLNNDVILHSNIKDIYWINPSILWIEIE